jgi:hypothetical protein
MTEREKQEIANSLLEEHAMPAVVSSGVPREAAPSVSVAGEDSIKTCADDTAPDSDGPQQADGKDESMEIHAPIGKVESLKEFATHILIVTIGILIALGLEGIRESWRHHSEVSEARESFRAELQLDLKQLKQDQASVSQADIKVDQIISDLPRLVKSPEELEQRVRGIQPGFYFFRTTAWESALSSGALTHMKRAELDRFVDAYLGVKDYQEISRNTIPEWIGVETYFQSHHSYSAAEADEGEQKLLTLKMDFEVMKHLSQEMADGIEEVSKTK